MVIFYGTNGKEYIIMRSFGWKNRFLRALWILLLPILAFGAENRLRIVQTTDLRSITDVSPGPAL